ncbi:hypothetical protein BD413DRAFT_163709 [Trametes elegans]|nr:hypothetical protein BD413DRAFT_163709 [Trametes elegans]
MMRTRGRRSIKADLRDSTWRACAAAGGDSRVVGGSSVGGWWTEEDRERGQCRRLAITGPLGGVCSYAALGRTSVVFASVRTSAKGVPSPSTGAWQRRAVLEPNSSACSISDGEQTRREGAQVDLSSRACLPPTTPALPSHPSRTVLSIARSPTVGERVGHGAREEKGPDWQVMAAEHPRI